jgi:hypothetical protein
MYREDFLYINIIGTIMAIQLSKVLDFTFINLKQLTKRDIKSFIRMHYGHSISCEHGTFIKVSDFRFRPMSSRSGGFVMLLIEDYKKYNQFEGYIDDHI